MLPALHEGDWLIARNVSGAKVDLAPGAIVVARDPRDGRAIIKRVEWCDAGYVSILGDNSSASRDSRHFGPLEIGVIESVVVLRYWPPERIGPVR